MEEYMSKKKKRERKEKRSKRPKGDIYLRVCCGYLWEGRL